MSQINFRKPIKKDGKEIFDLIKRSEPLDVNSEYLYLLQTTHFRDYCCVAEENGEIVGFISGYLLPNSDDTLFIWQVAIDSKMRGRGLAKSILQSIVQREELKGVKNIFTTVSPSNTASRRFFEKFTEEFGIEMVSETFIEKSDFVDVHEDEILYKIKLK